MRRPLHLACTASLLAAALTPLRGQARAGLDPNLLPLAAGYAAKVTASAVFVSGRTVESVLEEELAADRPLEAAIRLLLRLDVDQFEVRFARAIAGAMRGKEPRQHAPALRSWLQLQEEFWPALYFLAVIERRSGNLPGALDLLYEALELSPLQPELVLEMAATFAALGNAKRALELIEQAQAGRRVEARFVIAKASYLRQLGRLAEAREAVQAAFRAGLDTKELRKLGRALR